MGRCHCSHCRRRRLSDVLDASDGLVGLDVFERLLRSRNKFTSLRRVVISFAYIAPGLLLIVGILSSALMLTVMSMICAGCLFDSRFKCYALGSRFLILSGIWRIISYCIVGINELTRVVSKL